MQISIDDFIPNSYFKRYFILMITKIPPCAVMLRPIQYKSLNCAIFKMTAVTLQPSNYLFFFTVRRRALTALPVGTYRAACSRATAREVTTPRRAATTIRVARHHVRTVACAYTRNTTRTRASVHTATHAPTANTSMCAGSSSTCLVFVVLLILDYLT